MPTRYDGLRADFLAAKDVYNGQVKELVAKADEIIALLRDHLGFPAQDFTRGIHPVRSFVEARPAPFGYITTTMVYWFAIQARFAEERIVVHWGLRSSPWSILLSDSPLGCQHHDTVHLARTGVVDEEALASLADRVERAVRDHLRERFHWRR